MKRDLALPASRTAHSFSGGCNGSGHLGNTDEDLSPKDVSQTGFGGSCTWSLWGHSVWRGWVRWTKLLTSWGGTYLLFIWTGCRNTNQKSHKTEIIGCTSTWLSLPEPQHKWKQEIFHGLTLVCSYGVWSWAISFISSNVMTVPHYEGFRFTPPQGVWNVATDSVVSTQWRDVFK